MEFFEYFPSEVNSTMVPRDYLLRLTLFTVSKSAEPMWSFLSIFPLKSIPRWFRVIAYYVFFWLARYWEVLISSPAFFMDALEFFRNLNLRN